MAGHPGNQGSSAAAGVGAVGGGGTVVTVLPDRVDLPFVTETDASGSAIGAQRVSISVFPDRCWSADWRAWYALSQYVAVAGWNQFPVQAWDDTQTATEIDGLVIAARDERADALGEIVAQHQEFASYFFAVLSADPTLFPATNLLVSVASIVAAFTVIYYKYGVINGVKAYAARPRPSQVCPALLPPVPVPGHPSYPSGHATEAHLIRLVLADALNNQARYQALNDDLLTLANRIARNREIAGLHYPQDRQAGQALAASILPLLQTTDVYKTALIAARGEWA